MDILQEILSALHSEEHVMLATIISTNGSTPASALSKMLVKNAGKNWLGTVGGGCLEGDVLQEAIRLYNSGVAKILTFQLNETNIEQGLICGGSLDVLIEPLLKKDLQLFSELKKIRDEGDDCVLLKYLSRDGLVIGKRYLNMNSDWQSGIMEWWNHVALPNLSKGNLAIQQIEKSVGNTYHRNETQRITLEEGELILEPLSSMPHLVIFGGGHVSKYISRTASMAGFRVTIVDDRPEYANAQRFPEAARTLAVEFEEALRHVDIKPSTYIVIVTRGHRSDEEILARVVNSPAKYIGMIGSRRKVLTTYEHLVKRGVSVETLKHIHAPIGIEIGAKTAEEIGVSVVAQLIAVRRGEAETQRNKSDGMEKLITQISRI
jgi:xanthine dehydrogenase accessory factor